MNFTSTEISGSTAIIKLQREKVNALIPSVVTEIFDCLNKFENDMNITSVIITGSGKFFSFGFDIPFFYTYEKSDFKKFLLNFTDLYRYIFLYPKPVIAALNGHTIAGGCMIALSCDYRIMVAENAKISLNEITFDSTVFRGCIEMLRYSVNNSQAQNILYSGSMYNSSNALNIGIIDEIVDEKFLLSRSKEKATEYASHSLVAYSSLKSQLKQPYEKMMKINEHKSIDEFIEIWYSDIVRKNLKDIKIY